MNQIFKTNSVRVWLAVFSCAVLCATQLLTGCSKDRSEPVLPEGSDYDLVLGTRLLQTRANDDKFEDLDEIGLFAVNTVKEGPGLLPSGNYIQNRLFTASEAGNVWTPAEKTTFPADNAPLDLFLYYPWREAPFSNGTEIDFQVRTDQTAHADYSRSDFSTAFKEGVERQATVDVDFFHCLSRMVFQVKNGIGYPDLESLGAPEIRILNVHTHVVYDLASKTLLSSGNPQTVLPNQPLSGWENDGSVLKGFKAIVAPQTFPAEAQIEVEVNGTVYTAGLAGVAPLAGGKSRLFTITVGSSGIELKVTLNDWDPDGEDEFYGEEQDSKAFITKWRMQAAGDSVVLPLRSVFWDNITMQDRPVVYDMVVDWGDGSKRDTIQSPLTERPGHEYAAAGDYTVSISGVCQAFSFGFSDYYAWEAPRPLIEVVQWGEVGFESMESAFMRCENLTKVPGKIPHVKNYNTLFQECSSLTTIPADLFKGCTVGEEFAAAFSMSGVQAIPAGLFADCGKAREFGSVFDSTFIQSIPAGLFANCPDITNINSAFTRCPNLTTIPAGLFANCPDITNINYAFAYCSNLTTIPAGLFANCANIAWDVYSVFENCSSLKTLPDNLFANCSNVTGFHHVFMNCIALETISEDIFKGCSEATSFNSIFMNCYSLQAIPEPLFEDCSKVTSFNGTFQACTTLVNIPTDLFVKCVEVTSFSAVFQHCSSLVHIPNELFKENKKVTDFNYAFNGCTGLSGYTPRTDTYELWDRAGRSNYPASVSGSGCFRNCGSLTANSGSSIPYTWQ